MLVEAAQAPPSHAAELSVPTAAGCESLEQLQLSEVTSISAELVTSGSAAEQTALPEFCRIALVVQPAINIEVWLPTDTYNGRFQAIGGGGYAGAIRYIGMAAALREGYATAETDTGHVGGDGTFGLGADGELDLQLIEDFASRSLFQLTEKAKTLIAGFYGAPAEYAYWNGCSTGGRQGLMLAQQYPDGYDGILAGAPAINWDRFIPAELWPQVVMQQELGGPIAQCKLAAATAAAVAACDTIDGVADGVIGDPRLCTYDASALVGQATECGVFTAADARVVNAIWEGARTDDGAPLWYGLSRGAPLTALAGPQPFPISEVHHRLWIEQDPSWDWRSLDYAGFEENFRTSQQLFNEVIGTDDPDLSAFQESGGKVLLWHGWNDQLIFPQGTIDYYERVLGTFQDKDEVASFARLFMAPGVEHCRGGAGPDTFNMFAALVDWVENGQAPEQIIASEIVDGVTTVTRPLCQYPYVARYDGSGDPHIAASFECQANLVLTSLAGVDRYATAAAIAREAFSTAEEVLLANGVTAVDALAGSHLAGVRSAPILLTARDGVPTDTLDAISDLEATTVTVLGDEAAVSAEVVAQLEGEGLTVQRIGGADRYATAAAIARAAGAAEVGGVRTAVLTNGIRPIDAVVAGAPAYAAGLPVLLTMGEALSTSAAEAIAGLDIDRVLLVGGTTVLTPTLEATLTEVGIDFVRVAGADRRQTAVAVADYARANLGFVDTSVVLARGDDPADALAGGPLAGRDGAPILLTAGQGELGTATRDYIAARCATLTGARVLGGPQAVSAPVVSAAAAAAVCAQT